MEELITIKGVRGRLNANGEPELNLEDVSRGWGFTQIKNGVEYVRWETVIGYLNDLGFSQLVGKEDLPEYIPEPIVYRLGFKAKNEIAIEFQNIIAYEILPAIRKTGRYDANRVDESQLSPQMQLLTQMVNSMAQQEIKLKQIETTANDAKQKVDSIKDIVSLSPHDWRKETTSIVNRIAQNLGGNENIKTIRDESYKLLDERFGVQLKTRLTNKRRRMADEGVCKSTRDKTNYLDIIAEDKKLIEGYVSIIKEMAVKFGISAITA